VEKQIKFFFVTHLYEFAYSLYRSNQKNFLFLRAQRKDDGERTYKLLEAEPLQVSYGVDLYNEIFNHGKFLTTENKAGSDCFLDLCDNK